MTNMYLLQIWCGDGVGWATIARGPADLVGNEYADRQHYAPDAQFRTLPA